MKNNKGLTLVELLAVISLVALVGIIAFVAMDRINRENRDQILEAHYTTVVSSAISYVPTSNIPLPGRPMDIAGFIDNNGKLMRGFTTNPNCGFVLVSSSGIVGGTQAENVICEVRITLEYLMDAGVLDGDENGRVINPITRKPINMKDSYISIIQVEQSGTNVVTVSELRNRGAIGQYDGKWFYQFREVQ